MPVSGFIAGLIAALSLVACQGGKLSEKEPLSEATPPAGDGPPNILLIVADDLGYSDISTYGGEIRTPNLQKLVSRGQAFNQFYAAPTCSPTRSQLLTGRDNHTAGIGTMAEWLASNQQGQWGYEGHISDRVSTLAETLQAAGYFTAMSGKWHLGHQKSADPSRRGFQRSFALIEGVAPHVSDATRLYPGAAYTYRFNGLNAILPENFYSTRFYTDQLMDFLLRRDWDRPFFAYLSYTAPHDPLHVPDNWLDRYKGRYDAGYDVLRQQRSDKLIELGVVPDTGLPPRLPWVKPWTDLSDEERGSQARAMELYAAMIEYMDQDIGRLLAWLDAKRQLSNTLVIFLSDNGANGSVMSTYPGSSPQWVADNIDNNTDNLGRAGSAVSTGPGWAQASMAPFSLYKGFMSEGGVRVPAVIAGPGIEPRDGFNPTITSVRDLYPTLVELAGATDLREKDDGLSQLTRGRSIAAQLTGGSNAESIPFVQELFNGKMVRQGRWKALYQDPPFGPGRWQLFDLDKDVAELHDLAGQESGTLHELIAVYEEYARAVKVIEPPFKAMDIINKTFDPDDLVAR